MADDAEPAGAGVLLGIRRAQDAFGRCPRRNRARQLAVACVSSRRRFRLVLLRTYLATGSSHWRGETGPASMRDPRRARLTSP